MKFQGMILKRGFQKIFQPNQAPPAGQARQRRPWLMLLGVLSISHAGQGGQANSADKPTLQRYTVDKPLMGTVFKITVYAPNKQAASHATQAAFAQMEKINQIASDYLDHSELNQLNQAAGGKAKTISPILMDLLQQSQRLAHASDGAFDATCGAVVRQWRRARRKKQMPSDKQLAQSRANTGYKHLSLDAKQSTARLDQAGVRLDLGGIAKGYACQSALEILKQKGLSIAMVDGGGDLALGDPPPGKKGWTIALDHAQHNDQAKTVTLANVGLATSGDAFQFVELAGKRYSHIVDPRTGLGVTNRLQVTIIAPNATLADALASALCVMGPDKGFALLKPMKGTAARVVSSDKSKLSVQHSPRWNTLAHDSKTPE